MKTLTRFGLLIGFILFLNGCSSVSVDQVNVYEMENFADAKSDSLISYTDTEDIETFVNAFKTAKKEPGVVDMAEPDYRVEFGEESYFLWISPELGTIMNENDTNTIYSLTKRSAKEIYELVN